MHKNLVQSIRDKGYNLDNIYSQIGTKNSSIYYFTHKMVMTTAGISTYLIMILLYQEIAQAILEKKG